MTSFTASSVIMATMTTFLSAATPGLFTSGQSVSSGTDLGAGAARHLSAGFHYADVGRPLRKQMRVLGDGQDDPDIMTIDLDGYFRMSRNHHGSAVDGHVTVALASGPSRIAAQVGAPTVHDDPDTVQVLLRPQVAANEDDSGFFHDCRAFLKVYKSIQCPLERLRLHCVLPGAQRQESRDDHVGRRVAGYEAAAQDAVTGEDQMVHDSQPPRLGR